LILATLQIITVVLVLGVLFTGAWALGAIFASIAISMAGEKETGRENDNNRS